jgi:predicted dehydrogenase
MDDYHQKLYADHEEYDGYLRDGCVWRKEIDIYDKMSAQIKYANNVLVNYSLTTYSPYEGYRIAFNGTKGRVEAWIKERQPWVTDAYDEIQVTENFGDTQYIQVKHGGGGHGGGDVRMQNKIFVDVNAKDEYKQSAGSRDGAMSILIGIAARKSIEEQRAVKIEELTSLEPRAKKL